MPYKYPRLSLAQMKAHAKKHIVSEDKRKNYGFLFRKFGPAQSSKITSMASRLEKKHGKPKKPKKPVDKWHQPAGFGGAWFKRGSEMRHHRDEREYNRFLRLMKETGLDKIAWGKDGEFQTPGGAWAYYSKSYTTATWSDSDAEMKKILKEAFEFIESRKNPGQINTQNIAALALGALAAHHFLK
jgi:hypothetical protein